LKVVSWASRIAIALAAVYVLVQLAPVIHAEWKDGNGCPNIGLIPACYLVALCYSLMGIAALLHPIRLQLMFWIGWAPVFLLAAAGSTLELSGTPTCPVAADGTPMCFYSLALAITLAVLFFITCRVIRPKHIDKRQSGMRCCDFCSVRGNDASKECKTERSF